MPRPAALLAALLAAWTAALARGEDGERLPDLDAPVDESEDDVRGDGPCKGAIASYCADVAAGDGAVAHCLMAAKKAARAKHEESGVTLECNKEVRVFLFKAMKHSLRKKIGDAPIGDEDRRRRSPTKKFWVEPAPGMRKACERDVERFCSEQDGPAAVACLKAHKAELSPPCSKKLFVVQEMQAGDMTLDIPLFEACREDLSDGTACGRAPVGLRRKCLLSPKNRDTLSEKCKVALFKKEVEESEDLRLSTDVLKVCGTAISAECSDIPFGEARMLMCLWDKVVAAKREEHEECAGKVTDLIGRQVSHYQLDFRVRTRCADDIGRHCAAEKELVDSLPIDKLFGKEGQGGKVLKCLKEHVVDLQADCRSEMGRVARVQSMHADLDPQVQRKCSSEVAKYCGDTPREDLHLCLRRHFKDLGPECQKAEGLQARMEIETSVMRPKTSVVCRRASDVFCSGRGSRELRGCLEESMHKDAFPVACRQALTEDMEASNHDWQLKFGISTECQEDVHAHCREESGTPGTGVLNCLSRKHLANELIRSGCQEEVTRYLKAGAQNIRVLPDAFEACQTDVASYCPGVPAGQGRVHACLMKHKSSLSQECAASEFRNQAAQAKDIRMSPEAMKYCGPVMTKFCPGVEPGVEALGRIARRGAAGGRAPEGPLARGADARARPAGEGRMWACLFEHRSSPAMPEQCAAALKGHAKLKQSEFFLNPGILAKCKGEAKRLCPEQLERASKKNFAARGSHGTVISCLISKREEVQDPDCLAAVRGEQGERVQMAALDPEHEPVCAADIRRHCLLAQRKAELSRGTDGLVHKCLQDHLPDLSEACAKKEREYMVMASEEARLNIPIAQSCRQATQRWCDSVPDEEGLLQTCLLKHVHDESMEIPCRQALMGEQVKRATSLRFNPHLRKTCSNELHRLVQEGKCDAFRQPGGRKPGALVDCLTDHVEEIQDPACKDATLKVMQTHSADLRAKPRMHDACEQDLKALCPNVALGAGRGHECLRGKLGQIRSDECKKLVMAVQLADNSSATINYGVRTRCANEVRMFCPDVTPGESRVMLCLGIHSNETGFGDDCKRELAKVQIDSMIKRLRGHGGHGKAPLDERIGELRKWLQRHQGFAEEHGVILLSGTVGFVAVLTAWISWCMLRRYGSGKSGYTVVVPKDLSS